MNRLFTMKGKDKAALWAGISLMSAMCFMLFFYAPLELYFVNRREFWFDVYRLLPLVLVIFAVCFLLLAGGMTLLFFVFPKLYKLVLPVAVITFVCSYIQGNFLVGNLPPMDGTEFDWADYSEGRIYTVILWIVVTVVILAVLKLIGLKKFYTVVRLAGVFVILMLSLTLVSICITTKGYIKKSDAYTTFNNDYEFSEDQNFIILLLDAADSGTMYEMMESNPEYKALFEDFTYYRNTMGVYPCTMCAIPQILCGEVFQNQTSFDEYSEEAYKNSPLLDSLEERGYKMSIYEEDLPYVDASILRLDNVVSRKSRVTSYWTLAKLEIKLVGLRYAPFDLKRFCTFKMVEFSSTRESDYDYPAFTMVNKTFYDRMNESEISLTEDKCFKFTHIEGAHVPYQYDKDMNIIENGTYEDNMAAAMTITKTYLDKLKEAGVYDNSVIIVMADHGLNGEKDWEYTGRQNPILFVKGINEHHEMVISEAPVSYLDLQEAYVRLMDGKSSGEIFDWQEGDARERRYLYYIYMQDEHMYEYIQTGHASEDEMIATGNEYIRNGY